MKKIILFLVLSTVILSCSSDNNNFTVTQERLLGKWYFKGTKIAENPIVLFENQCATSKSYIDFIANESLNRVSYDANCNVITTTTISTWNLSNVTLQFYDLLESGVTTTLTYEVISISNSELQLKQTVNDIVYYYYYTRS